MLSPNTRGTGVLYDEVRPNIKGARPSGLGYAVSSLMPTGCYRPAKCTESVAISRRADRKQDVANTLASRC